MSSDRATLTYRFYRHGDILTLMAGRSVSVSLTVGVGGR